MPSTSLAVEQVSRTEYDRLVHRGHAGPIPMRASASVADRWRTDHPDWRGRYWAFVTDERGVLRLRPLNVTRAPRRAIAA